MGECNGILTFAEGLDIIECMKNIDIKSLIIGFLLCAILFLSMGLANNAPQEVRIIGIDKGPFENWDAIATK